MTVRKIIELIDNLKRILQDGGFSNKLSDYLVAIQNNPNNLVLLKEITDKLISDLTEIEQSDVPENLERILVNSNNKPFTDDDFLKQVEDLKAQNATDPGSHYNSLNNIITQLQSRITQNITELDATKKVVQPFLTKDYSELQKETNAIFALVFNNPNSFENLKNLSFELKRWDRGLFIYQQIISDDAPKAFEIVEIDQGSIEVVLNLAFEVADKLLELFKTGFEVYGAYLAYKTTVLEIIKSYRGNEKLIKGEEEREKLLLENVRKAIKDEVIMQSKKSKAKNQEAIEKKIDEVTKLLSDHIVKGNSVKLLSAPTDKEEAVLVKEEEKEMTFIANTKNYKQIDETTKQKLLTEYTEMPKAEDYEKELTLN